MGITESCKRSGNLNTGESQPEFLYKSEIIEEQEIDYRKYKNPSEQIAIELDIFKENLQCKEKQDKLNQLIFKFAEMQKKLEKPLSLKKARISRNQLKQLYFIESLEALYIGQWVYNIKQEKDVPGGIGRLFSKETIFEGVFKTFFLRDDQVWYNKRIQQVQKKRQNSLEIANESFSSAFDPNQFHFNNNFNKKSPMSSNQKFHDFLKQSRIRNGKSRNDIIEDSKTIFSGSSQKDKTEADSSLYANRMNTKFLQEQFEDIEKAKNDKPIAFLFKQFNVKLHGFGRILTHDIQMEGEFDQGVLHGKGLFKKNSINYVYDGFWQRGNKHGKGKQSTKDFIYEGDFVQNMRTGKGKLKIIPAARQEHAIEFQQASFYKKYSQEIDELVRDAKSLITIRRNREKIVEQETSVYPGSKIKFSDNHMIYQMDFVIQHKNKRIFFESYTGRFENNEKNGKGTYVWTNGRAYNGQWKHDKMNGYGQFYWPNGAAYQGTYEEDKRHGKGMMIWSSFKKYRGNWAYGFRHGYGQSIQIDETGDFLTIRGDIWDRDEIQKQIFLKKVEIKNFHISEDEIKKNQEQNFKKQEQNQQRKFLCLRY